MHPNEQSNYEKAVALIYDEGRASASLIQRHLQIGYNQAARIIDQMEKDKLISPANFLGKREVFVKIDPQAIKTAIKIKEISQATGTPPEVVLNTAIAILEKNEQNRVDAEAQLKPDLPIMAESDEANDVVGGIAGKRLRSFLDRVERLEQEKKALSDDIKMVYAEAKGVGFDVKTMRKILKLRKMEVEKRREEEELLDLYKAAIGLE